MAILVLLSFTLVAFQVSKAEPFSPIDEYVYFDYLEKVPSQLVVHSGELTGQAARKEIACRGVMLYGTYGDPCDSQSFDTDELYPYQGTTGADIYTPAYFAPTWVLSQGIQSFGLTSFDAARFTGFFWLSLGLVSLFLFMRLLGAELKVSLGISLLVFALPATFWSSAYISTDAPTLALVSGLGICSIFVIRQKKLGLFFLLLAPIAVLFKVQNIIAVGIFALWIILNSLFVNFNSKSNPDKSKVEFKKYLTNAQIQIASFAVLISVAGQMLWLAIRKMLSLNTTPIPLGEARERMSVQVLLEEMFKFFPQLGSAGMTLTSAETIAITIFVLLGAAAVLGSLIWSRATSKNLVILAFLTLIAGLAMGPFLALSSWAISHYYFPLPARYGLVLIPIVAAVIAANFAKSNKYVSWATISVGAALAAASMIQ